MFQVNDKETTIQTINNINHNQITFATYLSRHHKEKLNSFAIETYYD